LPIAEVVLFVSVPRFRWSNGGDGCRPDYDEPDHALLFQRDTPASTRSQWQESVRSVSSLMQTIFHCTALPATKTKHYSLQAYIMLLRVH